MPTCAGNTVTSSMEIEAGGGETEWKVGGVEHISDEGLRQAEPFLVAHVFYLSLRLKSTLTYGYTCIFSLFPAFTFRKSSSAVEYAEKRVEDRKRHAWPIKTSAVCA